MEQLTVREWAREQLRRAPSFAIATGIIALFLYLSAFIQYSPARARPNMEPVEAGIVQEEQLILDELPGLVEPEMPDLEPMADAPVFLERDVSQEDAPIEDGEVDIEFTEDLMSDALVPTDPFPMDMKMPVIATEGNTGGLRGLLGNRSPGGKRMAASRYGMPRGTDKAVLAGLRWLKATQEKNGPLAGAWNGAKWGGRAYPLGLTALPLLAFLGYGCTDRQPREFAETVREAIRFLMEQQARYDKSPTHKGFFGGSMYDQSICTLALAEAYEMTGNKEVRKAAQAGLDYILSVQATTGGFDYNNARVTHRQDMSITGFCLQAIKAGLDAGLTIPSVSRARTEAFLRSCATTVVPGRSIAEYRTVYVPRPTWTEQDGKVVKVPGAVPGGTENAEARSGSTAGIQNSSTRLTAVSLTGRLFLGHPRTAADCKGQAKWLVNHPYYGSAASLKDLYYIYYMSLSMFQMGGGYWRKWNRTFNAPVRAAQEKDGKWPPNMAPYAAGYGGSVYTTSLACLSLEVYYRYAPKRSAGGR